MDFEKFLLIHISKLKPNENGENRYKCLTKKKND